MMTNIVGCSTSEPLFLRPTVPIPPRLLSLSRRTSSTCLPQADTVTSSHIPYIHHYNRKSLRDFLIHIPIKAFVSNLIYSLTYGFNIGYTGPRLPLTAPNLTNNPILLTRPSTKRSLNTEWLAPFSLLLILIYAAQEWQLINHLSAPAGYSINDFIDAHEYSLQYTTVNDAIQMCQQLGSGTLMAKVDLKKNAFRLCPVRKEDWHLLGIRWRNRYYVDKCLPFGLRSAPYLFNLVAEALEWILMHYFSVKFCFHYLDNFF